MPPAISLRASSTLSAISLAYPFNVPNPGQLVASGKGVRSASLTAGLPDVEDLVIRAKGKAKKKLDSTGKAKVTVALTFTPTGGFANTTQVALKLKKA